MGRGPLQAYAYLMYSSEISSDALGRLHFLHEKSYLGAGFEIARRDLELRGATDSTGSSLHTSLHASRHAGAQQSAAVAVPG